MTAVPTDPLHPVLRAYCRQTEQIRQEVRELAGHLTPEQFTWRPGPGRWSVGECLGHLNAQAVHLPVLDGLIRRAREQGRLSQGPWRRHWLGDLFIRIVEPPYRLKVKTFPSMVPPSEVPPDQILPPFFTLQDQLIERMHQANGLDLGSVSAGNPARVRLTLAQWFEFLLAHERRHVWQAQNVARHPQFPR